VLKIWPGPAQPSTEPRPGQLQARINSNPISNHYKPNPNHNPNPDWAKFEALDHTGF